MKTIIALLTTTMLVAGATNAMAAGQGSEEAADYALSLQAARGSSAAQTTHGINGAFASARTPDVVRHVTVDNSANVDFQAYGR